MHVDADGGLVERHGHNEVGSLAPHPRKLAKILDCFRDPASKFLIYYIGHLFKRGGLLPVKPNRIYQLLDFVNRQGAQIGEIFDCGEEFPGDDLRGRLIACSRAQDGGN